MGLSIADKGFDFATMADNGWITLQPDDIRLNQASHVGWRELTKGFSVTVTLVKNCPPAQSRLRTLQQQRLK